MKNSLATDAVKLTTSKIISMIISMVTAMLLSRLRTLEEYGTYSQILLVINLITTIFMMGFPNCINFFLARTEDDSERQKFLSTYYMLLTILSFISGLSLVVNTPMIIKYFNNPLIKNFTYVFAIFPWTQMILASIENILIVYRRTVNLIWFRILNSLSLLLIIVIVEIFNLGFSGYMTMYVITQAIFAFSVYIIVLNISGNMWFSFDRVLIKRIFSFALPIGLASVVGLLSVELDKIVIGKFFSTEEIAIYANAARELPLTIISSSLTAVLMPQLVRLLEKDRNEEAISLWGNTITLSYIFICFFSIGLFTFAPEVISLLYSDKYLPGVTVFRIYNIVLLFRFTYFGIVLNSIGKTKFIFYSSIASLGLNVVLNYLLYFKLGFIGPAIATFISIAAVQIFQLIATSKCINIPFKRLFPWRALAFITLLNVGMGVLFAYIKSAVSIEVLTGEIIESVFLGVVWGIIYMLFMMKFIKRKWIELNVNY